MIASIFALFVGLHTAQARLGMGAEQLTDATFQAFVDKNTKVLVDVYDSKDPAWRDGQGELNTAIKNLRRAGSTVPFAKVDASKETALAKKLVPKGAFPQLLWFIHGEPTQYHRTLRTSKSITDFVLALDREAMVQLKSEEETHDFVPAVFARVQKNSPMYKTLEVVAAKHMDTVAFTFLEGSSNEISWIGPELRKKYTGAATEPAIEKWVRVQLLKSEAIPTDPSLLEEEGSKIVVGHSFEDIVLQDNKDVILQVYAPWCGYCKKFSTVWNSFAQEVKGEEHLVVAKMDGSRNSSPLPEDFAWESYPKVFMVPAGAKKPIHFEGDRTVQRLIDFVDKHGSKKLSLTQKAESRAESLESVLDL